MNDNRTYACGCKAEKSFIPARCLEHNAPLLGEKLKINEPLFEITVSIKASD